MVGVILFFLIHALFCQTMVLDISKKIDSGMDDKWMETMFSKEDFPLSLLIIYEPSISINVVFTRESVTEGSLEVLVYEDTYKNFIGKDSKKYCCTSDLKVNRECGYITKIGEVIRIPQPNIHDFKVPFLNSNLTSSINVVLPVNTTGTFVFLIVNCHDNGVGDVFAQGTVIWKNPYGFLPGEMYMTLLHNGILALLYMVVLIFFSILCIKYRQILMKIQFGILGLIVFALIEEAAWYFYRLGTNKTGYHNISALLFVVFLANVKQTLALVLVLLVSMGLGIVKWTLGTTRFKIGFFAVFHLFLWFLMQTIKEIEQIEKKEVVNKWVFLSIIIPAAILTTGFFYWILLSLIRTMQQLTLRRQVLKLEMYKTFFGVLVISLILASLSILYYWGYSNVYGGIPWKNLWILAAFTDFLFFVIFTSLAFLWRPRLNNTRYGYGEFFTDDNVGEEDIGVALETVNVTSGSSLKHRKTDKNQERVVENKAQEKYDGDRTKNLERLKLTDFERDIVEFTLPSDDEDDIGIETQLKKME